jgi:hypothetical protein
MVAVPVFLTARDLGRMIISGIFAFLFMAVIPGLGDFLGGFPIVYGYPIGIILFMSSCYVIVALVDNHLFRVPF